MKYRALRWRSQENARCARKNRKRCLWTDAGHEKKFLEEGAVRNVHEAIQLDAILLRMHICVRSVVGLPTFTSVAFGRIHEDAPAVHVHDAAGRLERKDGAGHLTNHPLYSTRARFACRKLGPVVVCGNMAITKSAKKAHRASLKKRVFNLRRKRTLRTPRRPSAKR
jgi:hypothetical protein